jgi:hypothetical protein
MSINYLFAIITLALLLLSKIAYSEQHEQYMFTNTVFMDQWPFGEGYNYDSDVHEGEISDKHFNLLGVRQLIDNLNTVQNKIGKGTVYKQSETSESGPQQICYKSSWKNDFTAVIFGSDAIASRRINLIIIGNSKGESDTNIAFCKRTSLVSKSIATPSGIKLGISPDKLNIILGKAGIFIHGNYEYIFHNTRNMKRSEVSLVFAEGVTFEEVKVMAKEENCTWHYESFQSIYARFNEKKLTWILLINDNDAICNKINN